MNIIKRRQFTDRLIKFTQSVYKIDLISPNPPLPVQLSSQFPKENVNEILQIKRQVDQLINSCVFIFDKRYQLMLQIYNYIMKTKIAKTQYPYLSTIILRSCCGLLFWNLVEIDVDKLLVFIKSLCISIPYLEEYKELITEYFSIFTEIIYKIPDIEKIIEYLPLMNELMLKNPKICGNSPILHLDFIIKLCHYIDQNTPTQHYKTISIYLKNFSKIVPYCVGIDFSSPKEKKSTEIIQLILQLVPKQATIDLLISYLALLMSFHKHDTDTIALLERISNGFIEETKTHNNDQPQETPASTATPNLLTYYSSSSNFVLSSNQYINLIDQETFPPGLNFSQIERPVVPNLNGIPPNFSKPAIAAASEISEHFLTCDSNEFLTFVNIMLHSQNKNILSLMIMMILSLPPHRTTVAQDFVKNNSWSILFNEQNFNLSENSKPRIVNLKQSIFDLISFLSIDKTVTTSIRGPYCNLLARFAKNPKLSTEILLMSYPQLKEIFSLPGTEDILVDILMQMLLNQQRFHMNVLTQINTSTQIKSIVEYRIQMISIIFKIIKFKEIMLSIVNSQYACEALFSFFLEKSLETLIEKVFSKLLTVASFPKVNHQHFTTALHQLILIITNQVKSIELLCKLFRLIEKNSTSILLKSPLIKDVYNAILLCKEEGFVNSPFMVELLELSLRILKNVRNFVEFDPRNVPFRTIGKVCSIAGLSDTIFQILKDTVINDNLIAIPEGVQMLMVATEGTERANYVLKILIELCQNSTCNRCSCIVGNTPILLASSFKFSQEVFELMKLIFYSIADAQSIWSFLRCFEQDSLIKDGILYLLDIVENSSENVKPLFQFNSVSARLCFPQISSSMLQNGVFVSATVFVDSKTPGRDFFEFRNSLLRFVVSFSNGVMLYRVESKKGAYSMTIDAEFPVKKWFDIDVLIMPSDGITISFDGEVKAGLGVPSFTLSEFNFDCILFQKSDISETVEPIQMNYACICADFQPEEVGIYGNALPETIKNHIIYKLSADNVYEGSLTSLTKLTYNAFTIPVASSFIHAFESTYSIKIILSLFRKIDKMPLIIDNLIQLVFKLANKSAVIARQLIECNGFEIIANFLSKLDPTELTIDRWKLLINEAKYIRNEPLMKAFAQDIFYNLNIWINASTSLQYTIFTEWKRRKLFDDIFQNVPFLLSAYEKFMNSPEKLKWTLPDRKKRSSTHNIKPILDNKNIDNEIDVIGSSDNANSENESNNSILNENENISLNSSDPNSLNNNSLIMENDTESMNSIENEILDTNNGSIEIDPDLAESQPHEKKIKGVSSGRVLLQSSLPINICHRQKIRNSISLSNSSSERVIKNYLPIRSLIISMLENYILKFKINIKDTRFLYQSIHNCPTPEITLELLDVIKFIISHDYGELLKIEGSEWLTLFIHKSEAVQIKWLSLFVMIYPTPSSELSKSILLLLISQSQRNISDNESSKSSILCAYCKACLYLQENIELSVINDHQNLCASPQYFHMAIALAIDAPPKLSELFIDFVMSLCKTQDNIERIAETSTPLTLFILVYWAIKLSIKNIENEKTNTENKVVLKVQSIDKNANKFVSLICSESSFLFETTLGIIDSIQLITKYELSTFRSILIANVFSNISKSNNPSLEFINIICHAIFYHVKIYYYAPLKKLFAESNFNSTYPNSNKPRQAFPDLRSLCSMYKELVPLLDSPAFTIQQQNQPANPQQTQNQNLISSINEISESNLIRSPSLSSTTSQAGIDLISPNFVSAGNPNVVFSLSFDENGNWIDKNLVFKLIFFIYTMKEESLRKSLTMLIYFFFKLNNLNESQPIFPIITNLLKTHDNYSLLLIYSMVKFKLFSLSKYDEISRFRSSQQGLNKRKRKRRYSDSTSPPDFIDDLQSSDELPEDKIDSVRSISVDDSNLSHSKPLSAVISSPLNLLGIDPNRPTIEKRTFAVPHSQNPTKTSKILYDNTVRRKYERSNTINPLSSNIIATCDSFLSQNYNSKFYENCLITLNNFCEDTQRFLFLKTYRGLIITLSEDPLKSSLDKIPLKFTTTRLDELMWNKLSHQLFIKNQTHVKRSSFVDLGLRPILLKRNFNFEDRVFGSTNSIDKQVEDSVVENRCTSEIAPVELEASRVKISNVIKGTFYIYSNCFKFISNKGKLLEILLQDIVIALPMICLQRRTAVELMTKQRKSFMFDFLSEKDLKTVGQYVKIQYPTNEVLSSLTDKWVKRQITNFDYLTSLNYYSGRTFNSAFSYPIFPWILSDYKSPQLKLDDPSSYRDLSKPIGALNEQRLDKLKALRDDNIDGQKFLYRSTYSCSFHIYHYLVRLEPFTSLHIMMQDGKFDVASRLFTSIENSYDRVIGTSFNFRELIPEFFFCSEFLENNDNLPLESGIENVELPPYSKSPLHFIYLHRQALESEYVSAHLHEWIDLIWGFKQDGQAAEEADNSFDPHLYPNVWKEFPDPDEKEQIEELLRHVGQIPQKLFDSPHPKRSSQQLQPTFSITSIQSSPTCQSEICCINRLQWTLHKDGKLYNLKNSLSKKIYLEGCGCDPLLCAPLKNGFASARKYSNYIYLITDDQQQQQTCLKQVSLKRQQHLSPISAICTIGDSIFSGDEDGIIVNDITSSSLYHKCPIVSMCGSSALSVLASLSADGNIVISNAYDLMFIRSIKPDVPAGYTPFKIVVGEGFGLVSTVALSKDKTKSYISTYSINGQKVVTSLLNFKIKDVVPAVGSNNVDYLILNIDKGKILLYNTFELKLVNTIFENDQNIKALAFFRDLNNQIYFASADGTLKYGTLSI